MRLKEILLAQIAGSGPLPFEDFQRAALYHPEHGFFSKGELRSTKAGDFLTSPEVSPLFGETLAAFVEMERQRLSSPGASAGGGGSLRSSETEGEADRFHLIEVGAGSGSLLRSLLASLSFEPEAWAIEASPKAREVLTNLSSSPGYQAPGAEARAGSVSLHVLSSIEELPGHLSGVVLANELIDNLPVAIAVRTEDGWRERWVGADNDELVLVDAGARPEVVEWCDRFAGPCPVDGFVEVQLEAARWFETALAKLDRGALVLIDYGDTAENLEPRRTEGTLRTYRAHHLGPHPLDQPGATDVTVDVNFTALEVIGQELGAEVEYHRQDDFLASLGLRERLSRLRRAELTLAASGDPMERLKIRSIKNEVETLLHPRGLGDFRVLVVRVG